MYFTSITKKAHLTYKNILEGTDLGVMLSKVVEETETPGKTTEPGQVTDCHMP